VEKTGNRQKQPIKRHQAIAIKSKRKTVGSALISAKRRHDNNNSGNNNKVNGYERTP